MARNLALAALVLALAACGKTTKDTPPPEYIVRDKLVPYECGTPPSSDAVNSRRVTWVVQTDAQGKSWYALTPEHYRNLMENLSSSVTGAKQLKGQRDFYVRCIAASREAAKKQNAALEAQP